MLPSFLDRFTPECLPAPPLALAWRRDRLKPARLLSALILLVAILGGVWFHSQGGLPLDPTELRERIASFGWVAPFGFVAIAALRPVVGLPSAVIMTAGGLVFGVVGGTLLSSIGMSIGAILGFSLARGLGKDAVQQRMGKRMERADAFLVQRGPRWLGAYTALPVSVLTPVHAAAGLSNMPFVAFALWVSLGLLPRAALYSYFGDSFTRGQNAVVAAAVVMGVVMIAAIFVLRRMFGSRSRSGSPEGEATPVPDPVRSPSAGREG
jgi:uncharacterized membrane protein YdjX (TVP38/TMEM64 family)